MRQAWMRRRTFAAQVIWIGISACAMRANAQAAAALHVERTPGAESCPDSAELGARVEAIRGQPSTAMPGYSVRFARDGRVYSAQLRAETSSLRSLESKADDCQALAQATAVTLALLYDAMPSPPAPEPAAPVAPPPLAAPALERPARPNQLGLGLGVGAGIAAGVLSPWSPAFQAEIGLRSERLRFGLGATWLPEQHLDLSPGTSQLALIAADARACYALVRGSWLRLEGCSGVLIGSLSAAASGYTEAAPRSHHSYAALPLELTLGQGIAYASWEISARLLIPYRRNQFEIEGLGSVYDAPVVSALLSLRGAGWFEL
jgi:hypothetical protein